MRRNRKGHSGQENGFGTSLDFVNGLSPFHRHVIDIVDDQMLIFDPKESDEGFFYRGKRQGVRRDVAKRANRDHKFAFDVVFGPEATNEDVFQRTTKDLVDVLFNGYNCSGK